KCSRHSIGDGLQDCVNFAGHLTLLLLEIVFKIRQPSILRCHEVGHQSFKIQLVVEVLRIVEGAVRDRTVGLEPVSPRLFCSGLEVYHFPLAFSEQDELPSSVRLDFRARRDNDRMYSGHLEA
nr:hypothetical protein [Tanacetum cinerariifolium]